MACCATYDSERKNLMKLGAGNMGGTTDIIGEVAATASTSKKNWFTGLRAPQALLLSSIVGLVGTLGGLAIGKSDEPKQESTSAAAVSEVLVVDSLDAHATNKIDSQANGDYIAGHLLTQALPSGKQIFAAARRKGGDTDKSKDKGNLGTYPVSFFQCSVDVAARTFDCGYPWLGTPGVPGEFFVYVGLADQNTAGTIIDALEDQAKSGDDKNWSHVAPSGFDALPGILVARR